MIVPFRNRSSKTLILSHAKTGSLITLALIIVCYFFIDCSLAQGIAHTSIPIYSLCNLLTNLIDPKVSYVAWPLLYFFFRCVAKKPKIAQLMLVLTVAIPVANAATEILKWACGRARPELLLSQGFYGFEFFSYRNLYHSFPSGHATTAGAIAGILSCLRPQWTYSLLGASLILSFTRVVLEMHFVSDLLGGVFIGALIAQWTYTKIS